jgi:hypothetical protein
MKKTLFATAIACLVFIACQKNKDPAPVPTHLGLWKGKYSVLPNTKPNFDVYLLLRKDGFAKVFNGADTTNAIQISPLGRWILSGNNINIVYKFTDLTSLLSIRFQTDSNFLNLYRQIQMNGEQEIILKKDILKKD